MVGLAGLEPATSRLSDARSNQLSYKPFFQGLLHFNIKIKINQLFSLILLDLCKSLLYSNNVKIGEFMEKFYEFIILPDIIMSSIRIFLIVFFSISLIYVIEVQLFMKNVFKHFKKDSYNYIPVYNVFILLNLIKISEFFGLLLFVPILNIVLIMKINSKLCQSFNKNSNYIWGMIFLPFIYMNNLVKDTGKKKNKIEVKEEIIEENKYSMKDLDVNLLTDKELDELNKQKVEEKEIDSIFKADVDLIPDASPYKAGKQKMAIVDEEPSNEKETIKRVETVKARDIRRDGKFIKEEDIIEKLDL